MEVFRISQEAFALKLTASGSANRWNIKGQYVIYTGSSRSLSTLELIVHKGSVIPVVKYKIMVISIADLDRLVKHISISKLPAHWRSMSAYPELQKIGSEWYTNQESLVLKVPSSVIPYESNYVINTEHPDFNDNVMLVRKEDYYWDDRLLK
jgi:RES domain-containing protein